jgi:hypothetical protein
MTNSIKLDGYTSPDDSQLRQVEPHGHEIKLPEDVATAPESHLIQKLNRTRTRDVNRKLAVRESLSFLSIVKGETAQSRDYGSGIEEAIALIRALDAEVDRLQKEAV